VFRVARLANQFRRRLDRESHRSDALRSFFILKERSSVLRASSLFITVRLSFYRNLPSNFSYGKSAGNVRCVWNKGLTFHLLRSRKLAASSRDNSGLASSSSASL